MRTSNMTVTVNLSTVAGILAKETSLSLCQAQNVVAKACGLADVGALKSAKKGQAPLDSEPNVQESRKYLAVRFDVKNGNFQDTHRAVMKQDEGESLEELQLRAWEYALFFYDDLSSCADTSGFVAEEYDVFLLKCINDYKESGQFSNADGELLIINVDVQESDKAHFDAMQMVNRI